jgi:hypothetical protein
MRVVSGQFSVVNWNAAGRSEAMVDSAMAPLAPGK